MVANHVQAMEGAPEGEWSDTDAAEPTVPTHIEEQEELKRSFLLASLVCFTPWNSVVCHPVRTFVKQCVASWHIQAAEADKGEDDMSMGAVGGFLQTKSQAGGALPSDSTMALIRSHLDALSPHVEDEWGCSQGTEERTAPLATNQDLLEEVFATGKGDDSDQFLKQYLAQRAWVDPDNASAAPIRVLDQVCCQSESFYNPARVC